jgi:hypothetical protein
MVKSVTIDACPLVYECQVIQKNDVNPEEFDASIPPRFYTGYTMGRSWVPMRPNDDGGQ